MDAISHINLETARLPQLSTIQTERNNFAKEDGIEVASNLLHQCGCSSLHDGQVHNPLGAGSYVFKKEFIRSHIRFLGLPDIHLAGQAPPTSIRTTLHIHVGAQPNNSPHTGTITVFVLAFLLAREIKNYYMTLRDNGNMDRFSSWIDNFRTVVQLDLVDTAPDKSVEHDNIAYQKSQKFTKAFYALLPDYGEVLQRAADFVGGGIDFEIKNQEALLTMPRIPYIIDALVKDHERLGRELSPETGVLAMRCACPHDGCGLAEKHGRKNKYTTLPSGSSVIEFFCPFHGYHSITTSTPSEVAKLEFNTPLRNLVRAFAYGIEAEESRKATPDAGVRETVHLRVTGADYTGTYSEQLLWRQLMLLPRITGLPSIPPPVIVYAPIIQDWSGSKLSKSLYVADGAYEYLKSLGMGYLVSFAEMKRSKRDVRILFREVESWLKEPKKLFRPYSIYYLHAVFEKESIEGVDHDVLDM